MEQQKGSAMSDEHYDRPIKVPDDVEAETYAILDGLFREYMDTIEEEGNEVNANSSPIELIDDFVVWLKAMQDMQGGSVQAPWAYVQVSVPLMKGTTGEWHEINNAVILLAERFHGVCVDSGTGFGFRDFGFSFDCQASMDGFLAEFQGDYPYGVA